MGPNMQSEQLRRLQLVELELLLEVDRICRKHHIVYQLNSGTLQGAVRPSDRGDLRRRIRAEYQA